MNPMDMMKLAGEFKRFQKDHPKVVQFLQLELGSGVPEGTVLELTITKPGERPVTSNMRVLPADREMVEKLKKLNK